MNGASRQELVDAMSALSQRATYQSWNIQTSNVLWLLARYGGTWGRLQAADASAELDEIQNLSLRLQLWPVLAPIEPEAHTSAGEGIGFQSRGEVRHRLRRVEVGGVIRQGDGPLHLRDGDPTRTLCGLAVPRGTGGFPYNDPQHRGELVP